MSKGATWMNSRFFGEWNKRRIEGLKSMQVSEWIVWAIAVVINLFLAGLIIDIWVHMYKFMIKNDNNDKQE